MREIIEYTVIFGDSRRDLIDKVSSLIKEGWQPFSELTLKTHSNQHPDFYQAMVKYKQDKPNLI